MCGIIGLFNPLVTIKNKEKEMEDILDLLKKRGPDDKNIFISDDCILGHRRLSIIDLEGGKQPFVYDYLGVHYVISYNGEIYNMNELKQQLIDDGYHFYSQSDTEVILVSYIAYGKKCVDYFDGIFAFIIYHDQSIFVARDHLGVKPLYYYYQNNELFVASEIKCILKYLNSAIVTSEGIKELLGLGPSNTPGKTIYKDIYSLPPGHYIEANKQEMLITQYFSLTRKVHPHSYQETIRHVRHLVNKSIHRQLLSDVPISCMLSGGLDSSIICAIASQYSNSLSTYSIDYEEQDQHFKAYAYQTTRDESYIQEMVDLYQNVHTNILLTQKDLADSLEEALIARDMPGMADIDSSFLLFCKEIRKKHKVVLSGECADEIFGGYPWFFDEDINTFPWLKDLSLRNELYSEEVKQLGIEKYVQDIYYKSLSKCNYEDINEKESHKRKMIYLHYQWFMQTLLTRADSQSMRASIEQRVPFASKEIIEYMYNIPVDYLYHDSEKSLLREAFKDFLPESIYLRKKNPYPKTHHPKYCEYVCQLLEASLEDNDSILYRLFNIEKLKELIKNPSEFTTPWFGQLMTGPQLIAYFYQIHVWGNLYHIQIENNPN